VPELVARVMAHNTTLQQLRLVNIDGDQAGFEAIVRSDRYLHEIYISNISLLSSPRDKA